MEAQPDVIHPSKSLPEGTVTFLFTDVEGSTSLVKKLGEAYAQVLALQRQILRTAFESCQGREVDTQGDAFFVAFAHAGQAIAAAIQAQQSLAAQAWPEGLEVRVRMGLHTGEPIVERTGYVGMDVHRAARIAAAGHGGQVLLSQTARDLVYQDLPPGVPDHHPNDVASRFHVEVRLQRGRRLPLAGELLVRQIHAHDLFVNLDAGPVAVEQAGNDRQLVHVSAVHFEKADLFQVEVREYSELSTRGAGLTDLSLQLDCGMLRFPS